MWGLKRAHLVHAAKLRTKGTEDVIARAQLLVAVFEPKGFKQARVLLGQKIGLRFVLVGHLDVVCHEHHVDLGPVRHLESKWLLGQVVSRAQGEQV